MNQIVRIIACAAGVICSGILQRDNHLTAVNQILRGRIQGPLKLSEEEKPTLAQLGEPHGRKLLAEVSAIVSPETIFRKIIAAQEEDRVGQSHGRVRCRERLGGLLKFYHRSA